MTEWGPWVGASVRPPRGAGQQAAGEQSATGCRRGLAWQVKALGDYDGDGRADVL